MDIYITNATELERYHDKIFPLLTRWRRRQAGEAMNAYARRGSVACSLLLHHVLNWTDDEGLTFTHGRKPVPARPPHFNMAYAKDYAVLAVDDEPVGVDIEPVSPFRETAIPMIYRSEEAEWLREAESELRFFTLWTRKESITKADGRGHLLAPKTFTIFPLDEQPHDVRGEDWYTESVVWDGYVIAAASRHPIDCLNIIPLTVEELLPPEPENDNDGEWDGTEEFYYGD